MEATGNSQIYSMDFATLSSWPQRNSHSVDSKNSAIVVAVIDTGIAPERLEHARLLPGINFTTEGSSNDTADRSNHGTAVARTILQCAPQTQLVPIKLIGRFGYLRDPSDLEIAFDWILEHQALLGINIVCMAFADSSHATTDSAHQGSRLQQQIAALRKVDVVTVAAAGNGYLYHRERQAQGMAWPAILREVVSVGALQHGTHGLTLTRTTQRLHEKMRTGCRTTVFVEPGEPGDTSGATAVVVGCLAALRGLHPDATTDALMQRLLQSRQDARDESELVWPSVSIRDVLALRNLSQNK